MRCEHCQQGEPTAQAERTFALADEARRAAAERLEMSDEDGRHFDLAVAGPGAG